MRMLIGTIGKMVRLGKEQLRIGLKAKIVVVLSFMACAQAGKLRNEMPLGVKNTQGIKWKEAHLMDLCFRKCLP